MAKSLLAGVPAEKLPVHIGFIMDGNGRWAAKRGLPRSAGHRQGADVFGKIAQYCRSIGIKYITVYAFSTENWKRPADEVEALMDLLRRYLSETFKHQEENARIRFLGERGPLAADIREMMERVEDGSRDNTAININIALNYGGRDEIVHAVRKLARRCADGLLSPNEIDEQALSSAMYTAGQPDPDLIIRPSGELRTSNFLLWQSAYAELVFMDVLWPDFTPEYLDQAILEYVNRERRFGGI
ncbi:MULTISPECIES: isoprenyl transferase [Anaerotruncus]|uniref:isoprenyl transferase n=1 Tax=Anaerotruncus TaxID=244127 RepID=UPI0008334475|nr:MULTISPECIES: isoprenyl transferase [Anaerotruncus]RGX56525.1 isoprenyl transferase [Anaerotruncus sp. AF02-27]